MSKNSDFKFSVPPKPSFDSSSQPSKELLSEYAPEKVWEKAISEANRSPMGVYGTGAVLFNKRGEILSNGCAHPSKDGNMLTTHAERHALKRAIHLDFRKDEVFCLICTISSRSGGWAWNSRPCLSCAQNLVRRGVSQAVYAIRNPRTGLWSVQMDNMNGVLETSIEEVAKNRKTVNQETDACFARQLSRC